MKEYIEDEYDDTWISDEEDSDQGEMPDDKDSTPNVMQQSPPREKLNYGPIEMDSFCGEDLLEQKFSTHAQQIAQLECGMTRTQRLKAMLKRNWSALKSWSLKAWRKAKSKFWRSADPNKLSLVENTRCATARACRGMADDIMRDPLTIKKNDKVAFRDRCRLKIANGCQYLSHAVDVIAKSHLASTHYRIEDR